MERMLVLHVIYLASERSEEGPCKVFHAGRYGESHYAAAGSIVKLRGP